jgi:hypothetical protein
MHQTVKMPINQSITPICTVRLPVPLSLSINQSIGRREIEFSLVLGLLID